MRVTPETEQLQGGSKMTDDEKERELWRGGFSGMSMIGSWIAAAIITVAVIAALLKVPVIGSNDFAWYAGIGMAILVWIYLIGLMLYRKLGMHYTVTNQRLRHREGILMRKLDRLELIDIDDVSYRQGPIQAILGVGNITVNSSDSSHPELVMYGIANVRRVADIIDDARRDERSKRGLYVEAI